jgi:glycosyltransferase involved in cell wall biosynthesis
MKLRIATYHNLPSGGAKRALFEMTRRLATVHDIDMYTLSVAEHTFCDVRPLVHKHRVYPFTPLRVFSSPFGMLNHGVRWMEINRLSSIQRTIASEINAGGYDVVLVHGDQYTQSPAVLQHLRVPAAYYCQDALRWVYDPPLARPYLALDGLRYWANRLNALRVLYTATLKQQDRKNLTAATVVLVNSRFSRETIYRIYAVQPQVCYLGMDIDAFRPLGIQKDGSVVSVGAVTPHKGYDFLIESLALLPSGVRPPLVVIANQVNQDEQQYLEALAKDQSVRVKFRSFIPDAELVELYNRACATLYAPVLEPFGFAPLESMACRTPVVGVAEGGVRETIRHRETGLLVDRRPSLFAQAVRELLEQPAYAEELGRIGRLGVQEGWSWDASVARLESQLMAAVELDRAGQQVT